MLTDEWLRANEPELRELRETWLGSARAREESDHLVDLLARRLAFMPHVAAWKQARGIAIEDPARERTVLARAVERAREHDLDPARMRAFFALQIELAKRVQVRAPAPRTALDLERQVRPALLRLGDRIVASLARGASLEAIDLAPLRPWLADAEIAELRTALQR